MSRELNQKNVQDDVSHVKNELHDKIDRTSKAAEHAISEVGDIIHKAEDKLKKQSAEVKDAMENYIKKSPFKAAGLSLVAGALIALLLRR